MTRLLGDRANGIDDGLLRELFFQRLPPNVQMVLTAAAPLPLAELAVLADKVWEVSASSVANISATTAQTAGDTSKMTHDIQTPNSSQDFVDQLCQRLEKVVLAATGRQDPMRSTNRRRRSPSPRLENDRSGRDHSSRLCYYHRRFGPDARRCQRPCAWPENRAADR